MLEVYTTRETFEVRGLSRLLGCPEDRLDTLVIHLVDEDHEVVAENLAQNFIVHCVVVRLRRELPNRRFIELNVDSTLER